MEIHRVIFPMLVTAALAALPMLARAQSSVDPGLADTPVAPSSAAPRFHLDAAHPCDKGP